MTDKLNESDLNPSMSSHTNLTDLAQMWRRLINEMCHFLFNKLAILQLSQISIDRDLPALIEGYSLAVKHKLVEETIKADQLNLLIELVKLKEHVDPIHQVFKTLLHRCGDLNKYETQVSPYLISEFIEKLLVSYPFGTHDRGLIKIDVKNNFAITVSPVLLSTILTEILDFAYSYVNCLPGDTTLQGDSIEISMKTGQQAHTFHCKIVTTNITESKCKFFTDRIFKSVSKDLLPGFGWCHLALLHAGIELRFIVKEKCDIEFIFIFPE